MSSIDKYMQDIASGYDRRVRVRNSSITKGAGGCNGNISFYIYDRCILTIKDRYGYISDSEKAKIKQAIQEYQRNECYEEERRRREEEERRKEAERRRKEEERRKEAERMAAYKTLVSSITLAENRVKSSYSIVTQVDDELKQKIEAILEALNGARYKTTEVINRLNEIDNKRKDSLATLTAERDNKINRIARLNSIKDNLTTDDYLQLQKELNSIDTTLTSTTFNREEVVQMNDYVNQLIATQDRLYAQRESFLRQQSIGGVSGEIAKLAVQQIDSVNKNSLEQIEIALTQLQQTQEQISASNTETKIFDIIESLRNIPLVASAEKNFLPRQSTYTHIDYASRCQEGASKLRDMFDSLKNKQYTTATQGELEHIERALQEFSTGMVGKNQLDSITSMTELVCNIQADDREFEDIFSDYDQLKEKLASYGVVAERLDVLNYESQREELLTELYLHIAKEELAQEQDDESADKRNMLAMGLRSAFAEQGLYFIGGRISESGVAEEDVFAIPGVYDAVVKAVVTEDSLHWYVCGTQKENEMVAAERVYDVMRAFDESGKPQKILNSFSQMLNICSGNITNAIDWKSPNALQMITNNGVFSLSQTYTTEDGMVISAGSIISDITREFAAEAEANKRIYAVSSHKTSTPINQTVDRLSYADRQVLDKKIETIRKRENRSKPHQHTTCAARTRYMR